MPISRFHLIAVIVCLATTLATQAHAGEPRTCLPCLAFDRLDLRPSNVGHDLLGAAYERFVNSSPRWAGSPGGTGAGGGPAGT